MRGKTRSCALGLSSAFVLDGFYYANRSVTLGGLHEKRAVKAKWNLGNSTLVSGNSDQVGSSQDLPDAY